MALDHLWRLMFHSNPTVSTFCPGAHLYILTDNALVTGELSMTMTDLAHTCLANYFSPHGHVRVSWLQREKMRRGLLAQVVMNHAGCMVETIEKAFQVSKQLEDAKAILFLTEDAKEFMATHKISFLDTLAVCLMTSTEEILTLDIHQKPINL